MSLGGEQVTSGKNTVHRYNHQIGCNRSDHYPDGLCSHREWGAVRLFDACFPSITAQSNFSSIKDLTSCTLKHIFQLR